MKKGKRAGDVEVFATPIRWIREALGIHDEKSCEQLRVMGNMFP
jgi:hypothetical protein